MADRTIDQLEIQGPIQIRRPLTASAKIQTALDVSQKCSHIIIRWPTNAFHFGVRKERATGSPKAILPVLRLPGSLNQTKTVSRAATEPVQAATAMSSKSWDMLVFRLAKPILCSTHSINARCRSPSSWIHNWGAERFGRSSLATRPSRISHGMLAATNSWLSR